MNFSRIALRRLWAAVVLLGLLVGPLRAQDGGPGTGGLVRLDQLRRAADNPHRVLMIGAHPDDEDTELLTILSRGMGVRTGYLSLTRGEGGQNLIGGELGAALGVVRASELLAARHIDGGAQFFTRAFDFGFSKTAAETFRFWTRDSVLKDVVRVVRRFRPEVIVSVFSGTPRDGHGHHQVAGLLAREAFDIAGDGSRFPELEREEGLRPWTPAKFYRDYGVTDGITLDGGVLDPATGFSLHQIAMRSRSQHRSQDMGQYENPGPSRVQIKLEARAAGMAAGLDSGIFAGLTPATSPDGRSSPLGLVERGIVLDAYVADHEVTPGQSVPVTLLAWNTSPDTIRANLQMIASPGWSSDGLSACTSTAVAPGAVLRCPVAMRVDADARPDQPYYLVEPMAGAMYRWTGDRAAWSEGFDRPLQARATILFADGTRSSSLLEVTARALDQGLGEVRRPVTIVPPVLLDLAPGRFLWPVGVASRDFAVQVEHTSQDSLTAKVRLVVPDGWRVDSTRTVHFSAQGERQLLHFRVTAPTQPTPGEVQITAEAVLPGDTLRLGARRINYPHIRERVLFHLATATAVVAPVQFAADRRVGYLRGAADAIPEALAAAGVPFRLLGDDDLLGGVLDSLDVVVVGPRAYEISDALRRAQPRLLQFAERGGTLIVQYQQYQFVQGNFAPLPLTIARPHDRVTDETAAVRWLPGSESLQRTPNRLDARDFADWIQERGLYFANTWDPAWQPLLEMDEPGEAAKRGGLLVAPYGQGTVIYTGIAFFRQLPAAVPGAWRLFANLLALEVRR